VNEVLVVVELALATLVMALVLRRAPSLVASGCV